MYKVDGHCRVYGRRAREDRNHRPQQYPRSRAVLRAAGSGHVLLQVGSRQRLSTSSWSSAGETLSNEGYSGNAGSTGFAGLMESALRVYSNDAYSSQKFMYKI